LTVIEEKAMSLLNMLSKSGIFDQLGAMTRESPDLARAASSLLSSSDTSVGGSGGLLNILSQLQSSGLGDVVGSWLGGGANQSISPAQLQSALGADTVSQFAGKSGLDTGAALTALAGMLPGLVDSFSPDGKLPEANELDSLLGKALRG
jgi:uncharacterized protein YidB (DUF937 family)